MTPVTEVPTSGYVVTVDAELALAYAYATNDLHPGYLAAEFVPPVYGAALAAPAVDEVFQGLCTDYSAVSRIHLLQDCVFHHPFAPGDRVTVSARPASVRRSPMGALLTAQADIVDGGDRVVMESSCTVLVPSMQDPVELGDPPAERNDGRLRKCRPRTERILELTDDQAFRYCAGSGDWQPLHFSDEIARAAGFPGVIVHGMCTMAMCGAAVVDAVADGDPRRLARLAMRFAAPVFPGRRLSVRLSDPLELDGRLTHAVWADSDGRAAIRAGRAEVRP